jgi:hypothetical protein
MNISLNTAQALLETLKRNPADAALLLGGKPYMELLWALGGIVYPAQAQLRNTGTATVRPSHFPTPGGNTMSNETALTFLSDAQDSMNAKLETIRASLKTGSTPDVTAITETLTQLEQEAAFIAHPTDGLAFLLNDTPELAA